MRSYILLLILVGLWLHGCATKPIKSYFASDTSTKLAPDGKLVVWKDLQGHLWRAIPGEKTWGQAAAACKDLGEKTDKNWRLASHAELEKARSVGIVSGRNKAFGWWALDRVWTANQVSGPGGLDAQFYSLSSGKLMQTELDEQLGILCVRPDSASSQMVWRDYKNAMEWQYTEVSGSYDMAQQQCQKLVDSTKLPWRLPSVEDLNVGIKGGMQNSKNKAFGLESLRYVWSNQVEARINSHKVFAVNVSDGRELLQKIDKNLQILCVRSLSH